MLRKRTLRVRKKKMMTVMKTWKSMMAPARTKIRNRATRASQKPTRRASSQLQMPHATNELTRVRMRTFQPRAIPKTSFLPRKIQHF